MRPSTLVLTSAFLLAVPRSALAWPDWGVSGGMATVSGSSERGSWQSFGPVVTTDITWRGGWSEVFTGVAMSGVVVPGEDDSVRPLSLLAGELGAGIGVPLFTVGMYGGWGWPGGTVGLYSRVTAPGPTDWTRRIGVEARLFAATGEQATGGALLVRIEPELGSRATARARREPDVAAPAAESVPSPEAPEAPPPKPPPTEAPPSGHHDDPYGG
jgi:hypothetical protein